MADYVYRSYADLEAMGRRVIEKAAEITMWQDESYAKAQMNSINDYTRSMAPVGSTANPHYTRPASGGPEDAENVKAYVRSSLADLPEYFTAFAVPDPDNFNDLMAAPLYQAAGTLVPSLRLIRRTDGGQLTTETPTGSDPDTGSISDTVDFITIHMKHWSGAGANQFSGYCDKLKAAAPLHHQFAIGLAQVMDAYLELRRRQLTDVWSIGEKTIKTLDALDSWCGRKKTAQSTLTVAGAVAAVVLVIATDGTAAPVAVEGTQSLATILSTIPSPTEKSADISGATVPAVISSMRCAIHKLHAVIDEQERNLQQALRTMQSVVTQLRIRMMVDPPDDFTALASTDAGTLRTTFFDR